MALTRHGYHLSVPAVTHRDQSAYPVTHSLRNPGELPLTLLYMAFQHKRFTRTICYHNIPWALTPRFHHHPPCGRFLTE